MFNDNDRGQVGIGTLIVFIAMVLVAAIAAGVLINTAGLLQSQAEATGEESSEQVTDRVQVSTVIGTSGEDNDGNEELESGEIDRIELTVLRSPGAGDIDLTNAILEVFAEGESATLTWNSDDDDGEEFDNTIPDPGDDNIEDGFAIQDIQGASDGSLSDSSDRATLAFDLSEKADTLSEGESVQISVTSASGGTAFVEKRAPSSIEDSQSYRL